MSQQQTPKYRPSYWLLTKQVFKLALADVQITGKKKKKKEGTVLACTQGFIPFIPFTSHPIAG